MSWCFTQNVNCYNYSSTLDTNLEPDVCTEDIIITSKCLFIILSISSFTPVMVVFSCLCCSRYGSSMLAIERRMASYINCFLIRCYIFRWLMDMKASSITRKVVRFKMSDLYDWSVTIKTTFWKFEYKIWILQIRSKQWCNYG